MEEEYHSDWDQFDVCATYTSTVTEHVVNRAYSMANYPEEEGHHHAERPDRVAAAPRGSQEGIPPGQMSSYIFNLKPGDEVTISGPFGEFFAKPTRTTR